MTAAITVSGLFVYPVKSCGGTALTTAEIGPRGFQHDREFMVVDTASGLFLTQREYPRMALIRPQIVAGVLRLCGAGMPPLAVQPLSDGIMRSVVVWRDRCRAVDQGDEAARWLRDFLQTDCRLVRMAQDEVRAVDPAYAVSSDDQVGFADGYPFLLLSEESLADLNTRLAEPLPMNRFRPNIVVSGAGRPYLEDQWRQIRIGETLFQIVKSCARCVITTTDQETAVRGVEPLSVLATYRRSERGVLFGQNLMHTGTGSIRLGDEVLVVG